MGKTTTETIHQVRIDDETWGELSEIAERERRSVASLVAVLVEEALAVSPRRRDR